eukprot:TRINITY_DN75246_c0_g1_i1.p1 TRINITY_DN75246_c0_g1~~TRINITY_DN75246_c0_g1_i1.p1  ORF type:complete len:430 (-),score=110.29 TRINITY_DN75246_c0_g1_i1:125-1414(-)
MGCGASIHHHYGDGEVALRRHGVRVDPDVSADGSQVIFRLSKVALEELRAFPGRTYALALHTFDPTQYNWPFDSEDEQPLGFKRGALIRVIHIDEGNEWAYGHVVEHPSTLGHFPRNRTIRVGGQDDVASTCASGWTVDSRNANISAGTSLYIDEADLAAHEGDIENGLSSPAAPKLPPRPFSRGVCTEANAGKAHAAAAAADRKEEDAAGGASGPPPPPPPPPKQSESADDDLCEAAFSDDGSAPPLPAKACRLRSNEEVDEDSSSQAPVKARPHALFASGDSAHDQKPSDDDGPSIRSQAEKTSDNDAPESRLSGNAPQHAGAAPTGSDKTGSKQPPVTHNSERADAEVDDDDGDEEDEDAESEPPLDEMFKEMDLDGDGEVTKEEFEAVYAEMDKDGDGQVTKAEFEEYKRLRRAANASAADHIVV